MLAAGRPRGRYVTRWPVWSVLICLLSAGCGRTGLGARADVAAQDSPATDSVQAGRDTPADAAPDSPAVDTQETGRDTPAETAPDAHVADTPQPGRDGVADGSVRDVPIGDSPDSAADGSKADVAPAALSDGPAETGRAHCTPGLFTLGGWPAPHVPAVPSAIAIGDLNGDGHADLATTGSELDAVAVLLGHGDGTFAASATTFATGRGPAGLAIADVNGDGKPDLMVTNSRADSVSVLLGAGDGSFAAKVDYPAGREPSTIAVGDFTGDGHPDIAVASSARYANSATDSVTVLQNHGTGTFAQLAIYQVGPASHSLAMGDLDGDGRADLAVAGWYQAPLTLVFARDGGTVVTRTIDVTANAVVMGDLDGDGSLDLAWSTGGAIQVSLNQGDGVFAPAVDHAAGPVVACPSYNLHLGDVNADGRPDLVALNDDCENVTVLLNQGGGRWSEPSVFDIDGYPLPMAVGDLNGDDRADLVLGTGVPYLTVLLARPDGGFTPDWLPDTGTVESYPGAIGDLDGDGRLDLVRVEDGNAIAVWLGQADGTLAAHSRVPTAGGPMDVPAEVQILDVNGDGTMDVTCRLGWSGVSVLLGQGHGDLGTPVSTTLGGTSMNAVFGDLDGDGDLDLVATPNSANDVSVLFNRGDGRFGDEQKYAAGRFPRAGLGDLNADGKLDLVLVSAADKTVSLLFGRGDGTFDPGMAVDPTGTPGSPFLADLNGDGITDLIVTSYNPNYRVGVLLGRPGSPGVLRDTVLDFYPDAVVGIGDMDKDGHTDLVFRWGARLFVLRGAGDGSFLETLAYQALRGSPMALVDFDGNGRLDVVVAEGVTPPRWHVYRNDLCP